jgi:hypothetical protein
MRGEEAKEKRSGDGRRRQYLPVQLDVGVVGTAGVTTVVHLTFGENTEAQQSMGKSSNTKQCAPGEASNRHTS